jgi:hypothetical protein
MAGGNLQEFLEGRPLPGSLIIYYDNQYS